MQGYLRHNWRFPKKTYRSNDFLCILTQTKHLPHILDIIGTQFQYQHLLNPVLVYEANNNNCRSYNIFLSKGTSFGDCLIAIISFDKTKQILLNFQIKVTYFIIYIKFNTIMLTNYKILQQLLPQFDLPIIAWIYVSL